KVIALTRADGGESAVAILVNAHDHPAHMRLSLSAPPRDWDVAFCSSTADVEFEDGQTVLMPDRSIALLIQA
ncbi:MAG: hypothetical protein MJA32_03730, partial [Proteobacteria bacterium]|nr:hypothetical protein [Pseudomonadota bacterium]